MPSKEQLNRLEVEYKKIVNSGYTIHELKSMNRSEYNNALGKKITSETSLKAQFRLLDQIQTNISEVEKLHYEKRDIKNEFIREAIHSETNRIFKEKEKAVKEKEVKKEPEKRIITENIKDYTPKAPDKPKEQYGIIEVQDKHGNSYWIKYRSVKQYKKHFSKLEQEYNLDKAQIINHGFQAYIPYVDKKYKQDIERLRA